MRKDVYGLSLKCAILGACLAGGGLRSLAASSNLLQNAGFEQGEIEPYSWRGFPSSPQGIVYVWANTKAYSGTRSARIDGSGTGIGMWQQVVPVDPDRVYELTAYVGFEGITSNSQCNLQLVFRKADNQVVRSVDLPAHTGTRDFALDFPPRLKIRAPTNAACAEVNCYFSGVGKAWFDDVFFGPAPVGTIAGTVTGPDGPVSGAVVRVWGDPWERPCEAQTDGMGRYVLTNVPVAFPRYVLLASRTGYRTRPAGDVAVLENGLTTVDFALDRGLDPDNVRIKFGNLVGKHALSAATIPTNATIPSSTNDYPEHVCAYLQSDQCIQSDNSDVVALANQLLGSLSAPDRTNTRQVAQAIHEWVSIHVEHDGVFSMEPAGLDQPFRDVSSGIWQTISGEGWAWGRSFYDWAYRPPELLAVESGICVEHSWLVSALFRALGIPARASVGSLEFWAQTSKADGVWVHMSTTGGRTAYREYGKLDVALEGLSPETRFSVLSRPVLHEDWNAENKGLWRETHPWGQTYAATVAGYTQAVADLIRFAATGTAPRRTAPPPGNDSYRIDYSDITISLLNIGTQRVLDVRFPQVTDSPAATNTGVYTYWINHPECVTRTWIETITNPPVLGTERWFHVEVDLTDLLDRPYVFQTNSPFGFHPATVAAPGYEFNGHVDGTNIGVRWTREGLYAYWFLVQPSLASPQYNFTLHDRQWSNTPTDMTILANIAPEGHTDEGRCLPGSYLPINTTQYLAFVKATVERYDGDGIDDMPGLTNPIRYWQVGNEPNSLNRTDFAELQRITYQAIKEACSECVVLIGGATGFPTNYVSQFDARYAPILTNLNGQCVDVFDFHWYGTAKGEYSLLDTATGEDVLDHIRATLSANGFASNLPIWITEMGSYSGDPVDFPDTSLPFQSERQQAGDYFKRFIYPLSRGVAKVFPAFGLMEGFKHENGYFDHTGLIYNGEDGDDLGLGVRKLSYHTYKRMTQMLEGSDWSTLTNLHHGAGNDHLYVFRVMRAGTPVYVAWWDYFDEPGYTNGATKTLTLDGLTGTHVSVSSVIPTPATGQSVSNEVTAFAAKGFSISDGSVSVPLDENPVFVENDTDADGLGDILETVIGLDPLCSDTDADGLTDREELWGEDDPSTPLNPGGYISDPAKSDTDNDGMSDGNESVAGTDPSDETSFLAVSFEGARDFGNDVVLNWLGCANRSYEVHLSTNLLMGFTPLTNRFLPTADGSIVFTNHVQGLSAYYRIAVGQ